MEHEAALPGPKSFYVTAAIDYPNAAPHIGHAYEKVAGDALARYQRLRGRDAFYLLGNDEHSQNVMRAAQERGESAPSYCARMAAVFASVWEALGIRCDRFMRTDDPRHQAAVQSIVQRLHDRGHVYRGVYRGWYCVSCEAFVTEKEVDDGNCPVHHRPVERVEEENWFFRLSAFGDAVAAHLDACPQFIQPEARRNEVRMVLRTGLEDVSISRAGRGWGVPLPWDAGQVVYVWFDALITYLSGAGFGWDPDRFARLWPADVHLIGKDITRFHAIIWPAMLLGAGLPLPRTIFAHGFMNLRGEKLSKTTGNVVDPLQFRQRFGLDATRYYLLAETPFGNDGNFTPDSFIKRFNSDLANDLGNLLNRVVAMVERFCDGRIPEPPAGSDDGFAAAAVTAANALERSMEGLRLHEGPPAMLALCARANKYIDEQAPWDLVRRGERERLNAVLYNVAEVLRILAVGLSPFLVEAPAEIARQLGLSPSVVVDAGWDDLRWGGLAPRTEVRRGEALFARLDPDVVRVDPVFGPGPAAGPRPGAAQARPERPASTPVGMEDLERIDLRVGTIVDARPVEGADRLLVLRVDLGEASARQIVSGIAHHYAPQALLGRQVVVVANLKPARFRGVRSEGMLLAAGGADALHLIGPDGPVAPGDAVR